MTTWQSTQTRGFIKALFLILMTSAITMGSSIASPTPSMGSPTSEESTSCKKENPEEESVESQVNQIGNDTLEALKSLNETLKNWAERISEEKSSQSTVPLDKPTTKKPDNSSSTTCSQNM